ncbi:lens intrinsic membrane protein 2.2 isoform X1 [Centroberyx affinis]|uniref:lens intrinsic membrane protein 2.2 isoform X1 n=1 Tax=Centroberyx affinis TaxID=166261 RepID=UPI003A5BAA45
MSMPENNCHKDEHKDQEAGNTKEGPGKQQHITVCLVSAAFFGAFGSSFLFGYNVSVVNAPALFVKNFINKTWIERYGTPVGTETVTLLWAINVSIMAIGGLLGAIVVKFLVKALGRRGTLLVNNCFSLVAAVLQASGERAHSFEMLIIGRFIIGINTGISLSALPMYLGEISPRHIRGSITQFNAILINLGVLTGQIMGLPEVLGQESRWNFLFAFIVLPALLQLSVLSFLPESPRYLLMEKKDKAGAEKAFRRFLGKEDVTSELAEVHAESQAQNLQIISVLGLLRNRAVRWQIITVIVTMACFQLSGVNALFCYTNVILTDAGITESLVTYITLSIGGIGVISTVITGLLIERVGRRPLLVVGFSGLAVCYSLLTVFLNIQDTVSWMPYVSFACILTAIAFFCLGLAGTTFILTSELFEQSYRPTAFLIGGSVFWLCNFTVGLVFPFIQEALQTYVFLVFVVVCSTGAVYLFIVLPETKNKTFVDISQSFAKRNKISNIRSENVQVYFFQETQTV